MKEKKAANTFKSPAAASVEKQTKSAASVKKIRTARKWIAMLNVFSFVDKGLLLRVLPFILFTSTLMLFYIANGYIAEKTIREIDKTTKEIKELRSESVTVNSELMSLSRKSVVAKKVEPMGIRQLMTPPKKILLKAQHTKQ